MSNFFGDFLGQFAQYAQAQQAATQQRLQPFKAMYRVYPVVMANKPQLEAGDKIILPSSALEELARRKVTYPMMFRLVNPRPHSGKQLATHCGVMEFSAEEGTCFLPYWMMQNLLLESGAMLELTNTHLPKGSFLKFQPHTTRFTQLSNPKAVLERALRNFSCLTRGDTVAIQHGNDTFYLDVVEVQPGVAVSVIETDVNVEFQQPKDWKEPTQQPTQALQHQPVPSQEEKKDDKQKSNNDNFVFHGSSAQEGFGGEGWGSSGADNEVISTTSSSTSSSSSSSSSYFAKLGAGHRLKDKKTRAGASPASSQPAPSPASPSPITVGARPTNSNNTANAASGGISAVAASIAAHSRPASAKPASSSSSSLSSPSSSSSSSSSSSPASCGVTQLVERQGRFDYVYEVLPNGSKRLLRRTAIVPGENKQ